MQRVLLLPEGFCDHRFCILLNPFERVLSEYRYRATRRNPVHDLLDHIAPGDRLTVELDWASEFCGTFDEWLEKIFAEQVIDPYHSDNHIRPQAEFARPDLKMFLFEDGLEHVFSWSDQVTYSKRAMVLRWNWGRCPPKRGAKRHNRRRCQPSPSH